MYFLMPNRQCQSTEGEDARMSIYAAAAAAATTTTADTADTT